MDQIERADVEGRGHANLAAEIGQLKHEIKARAAEIETAVDMRRLDIDEAERADRLGETREEPHRERRAAAMGAAEEFVIERGEVERHRRSRYRRAVRQVNVRGWRACVKLMMAGDRSVECRFLRSTRDCAPSASPFPKHMRSRCGADRRIASGTRSSPSSGHGATGSRSGARSRKGRGKSSLTPSRRDFSPLFRRQGLIGVGLDEAADWREVEAFFAAAIA